MSSVPNGPYIPQIFDASDPDVKTSAMQAALSGYAPVFVRNDAGGLNQFAVSQGDGSTPASILFDSQGDALLATKFAIAASTGIVISHGNTYVAIGGVTAVLNGVNVNLLGTNYVVTNPANFRDAIGVYQTFGEYIASIAAITSDPGVLNAQWNDNGTFKFSTGSLSTILQPDGFGQIFQPDGVSLFLLP